jgi:hypothetical protein
MRGFDDLDSLAGNSMAVARNHETAQDAAPIAASNIILSSSRG